MNILNEVSEKVRQQGKLWRALEASKGSNWYLQTHVAATIKSSLNFSNLVNAIALKRLIRNGIPPVLRPQVLLRWKGRSRLRLSRLIM